MTSSDVLDTCFNVQLVRAADILIEDVDRLLAALKRRALRAQEDADGRALARHPRRADHVRGQARVCLCRVFARRASGWSRRARRSRPARSPARSARSRRSTRASRRMSPRRWGFAVEPVSTQVIPRDRHAMYLRDARRGRLVGRAARDRNPPPAAHRGAGGRGVLLARARRARRRCRTSATRC